MEETKSYTSEEQSDLELYGDPGIASRNAPTPRWLIFSNIFFGILGFVVLYFFWNGSYGWLDRGYWNQLQRAANTVYPYTTMQIVEQEAAEKK